MRDSQDFKIWIEEQKRIDKQNAIIEQAKRKIEMELAHEAALKAIEDNAKMKKVNADEMKAEKVKQEKKKQKMKEKDTMRKI